MVFDYFAERKLRPLYEAIDDGQNKLALQTANKMLKKNPNWTLVKALKALALVRTGKEAEAAELCDEVKKATPTDESTLHAVSLAYKELRMHPAIVDLYENAANAQSKNEQFGHLWFMAMVQNGDYKGQHRAALKLHRSFKHDKYLFWTIMSLVLQGQEGHALSYTLAERMMDRANQEGRLTLVEHLRLFLLIYLDQEQFDRALTLIEGPLGVKSLHDPEVGQIRTELLMKNNKWETVRSLSQASVKENSDDWFHWLAYFDAVDQLIYNQGVGTLVSESQALVEELKGAAVNAPLLKRGPFLAELELTHRLKRHKEADNKAMLSNVVAYFERFGSKSCCFEDVHTYIDFLNDDVDQAKELMTSLQNTVHPTENKAEKVIQVYKRLTIRKLERYLNLLPSTDPEQGLNIVRELYKSYEEALPLGEQLNSTEYQYGDDFVLLASHILVDLYHAHQSPLYLVKAITLLEIALAKSTYNFQLKLALVRIYTMLGVYVRPVEIYTTMDIKQIQFDTMTHYFTDRFISLGCLDTLRERLGEAFMIYKSNDIETPDMLVKAYQQGTYSKIQEFIIFRKRLDTSLQRSISDMELARVDAMSNWFQAKDVQSLSLSTIEHDDKVISSKSDNRDFKVFMDCNSSNGTAAIDRFRLAPNTNSTWLTLFSLIMHLVGAACQVTKAQDITTVANSLSNVIKRDNIKNQVTAQELWLANYVYHLALVYIEIQHPKSGEQLEKERELQSRSHPKKMADANVVERLDAAIAVLSEHQTSCNSETPYLTWLTFHDISILIEAHAYGAVMMDAVRHAAGCSKSSSSDQSPMLSTITKWTAEANQVLVSANALIDSAREKIKNRPLSSDDVVDVFLTPPPTTTARHVNIIESSWRSTLDRLAKDVQRHVQR